MTKKVTSVIVLLAVIAVVVIWSIHRTIGNAGPPEAVLQQVVKKIDYKTREIISLPLGQWDELRDKNPVTNVYKNPKTGEWTVVNILKCPNCGAEVPTIAITDEVAKGGAAAISKLRAEYKCPVCGKCPLYQ